MRWNYVDAHCHIQFKQYEKDDAQLIERMREEGVVGVVVGVDSESSAKAIVLAEKHEHLFASVGLHPNRADEGFDPAVYQELAGNPKAVAIGECGLDYFRPVEMTDEIKRAQKSIFAEHIKLAALLDKPLIIHARPSKGTMDAYGDLIGLLKESKAAYPSLRGDIHFFVGGRKEAEELIGLGFTLSFTAVITFTGDYDAVIRALPLASILAETDAPFVAPKDRRGKRNDPLSVRDVATKLAEIRGEPVESVRAALLVNAKRLFALPIHS